MPADAPAAVTPPAAPRLWFLDALRILAFGLLIPYHVGMVYVPWSFHWKSPALVPALQPLMLLTNPWRMSLLFVVSGAATAFMLASAARGAAGQPPPPGWLRQRLRRLLLPLLLGMVLVVPPQAFLQVQQQQGYAGGYADFLRLYFTGYHGFCDAAGRHCLMLPTWNHLWFLPYLAVYTALLWALLKARPGALDAGAARIGRLFAGIGLVAVPVLWLALVRWWLKQRFPETHALVDDWGMHLQYGPMFLVGALLARAGALGLPVWPRIEAARHLSLALALAGYALAMVDRASGLPWPLPGLALSLQTWCAILAALGYARRHLNRDFAGRRRLGAWVFTLYVVHQTVILLLARALVGRGLPLPLEGALLLAGAFAGSLALAALVERWPALWPWFGMADGRAAAAARPAPA